MSFYTNSAILLTTSALEDSRRRLTRKLRKMAELPTGFSHGEGLPVTQKAVNFGEQLILLGAQLELNADVFPNLDGGCAVAFYNGDKRLEVSVSPDAVKLDLRLEHGIGFAFEDAILQSAGHAKILDVVTPLAALRFCDDIWKLYASSTYASSTAKVSDFGTYYSGTPQEPPTPQLLQTEKGGSQSLNSLVPALTPP